MLTMLFILLTAVLVVGAAELVRGTCRRQLSAPVRVPVGADSATTD